MRFKRRRNRGLWYPLTQSTAGATVTVTTAATGGNIVVTATPIIYGNLDEPADATILGGGTIASLGLTITQGYLVKRICGKIFASSEEAAAGAQRRYAFSGLIVDRTDQNGGLANIAAWNPFSEDSVQKRWLWRRTWALEGSGAFGAPALLSSNNQMGSVLDGPHCDCKSKARVTYQERLFLINAVQNGPGNSATNTKFVWHLRMFASPIQRDNR